LIYTYGNRPTKQIYFLANIPAPANPQPPPRPGKRATKQTYTNENRPTQQIYFSNKPAPANPQPLPRPFSGKRATKETYIYENRPGKQIYFLADIPAPENLRAFFQERDLYIANCTLQRDPFRGRHTFVSFPKRDPKRELHKRSTPTKTDLQNKSTFWRTNLCQ